MSALPPLRHLEPMSVTIKGDRMVCLTDPHGFVDEQMVLSPPAFFIAACLDGERDVAAVQQEFSAAYSGATVPEERILEIVETLDKVGFLMTDTFARLRLYAENAFRARHTRAAALAGQAYPDAPEALRTSLDRFFVDEQGPGALERMTPGAGRPLHGLIAPHIDFERGGNVYGAAYRALYAAGKPDLVILFGVAHTGSETPFILTRKHFETPLGILRTDQDVVTRLEKASAWDPYAAEMTHRMEHSLEFQAVMLTHLYGTDITIVPILCSFPHVGDELGEDEWEGIHLFLEACSAVARQDERRVTVIAGADLAHVGKRFGDNLDITEEIIAQVRESDLDALRHVTSPDAKAFYHAVMQDGNARHVCGLGAIYATLKTLDGVIDAGEILTYDSAPDPIGGIVSFAGIALP